MSQDPLISLREKEALKILNLITEGYFVDVIEDKYIRCKNPKYSPDNGENPYIIWDNQLKEEELF